MSKVLKSKQISMIVCDMAGTTINESGMIYESIYNTLNILGADINYLDKMNDLHEVQKTILKYLKGLENIYPGEIKGFLRNLHSELKKYEDDPYEKRAFLYLDIISWLESKISNKPVQVIIKEKALLINRK